MVQHKHRTTSLAKNKLKTKQNITYRKRKMWDMKMKEKNTIKEHTEVQK